MAEPRSSDAADVLGGDVQGRTAAEEDADLAAALAAVLGMSWESGDEDPAYVSEWSPQGVPEPASPELWASEASVADWSPEGDLEPSSFDAASWSWEPEAALPEWSPDAAPEFQPPDSGLSDWWDAWSTDADADPPPDEVEAAAEADVEAAPETGSRRTPKRDEATAALQDAGMASPLTSALGTLGRVIPGEGGESGPSPAGRPEAAAASGGLSSRLPEWLSVAALRETWATRRRDWVPGLMVAALIVVAFAVVLAAGGRDDNGSEVRTEPRPTVTSPDTTLEVPTTLPTDVTVPVEEAPVVDAGVAATPSGPARPSGRARSTPTTAKPKAAPRAPAPAPAPKPPPADDIPTQTTVPRTSPTTVPQDPDPTVPEPPDPDARCGGLPPLERADCLKDLTS